MLGAGAVTSARADVAGIEVDVGDSRGEILALCASGRHSYGNEPKLQGRCSTRAYGSYLAGCRGLAELRQDADF